jgi:hypothetical protein
MKVIYSSPTYGPADQHCVSSAMFSQMYAANHGIEWAGVISPDRMTFSDARNMVAEWAWENPKKMDGIVWIDSDIVLEPESIHRMLSLAQKNNYDVVSGLYHQRREPYEPVVFQYNPERNIFKRAQTILGDKVYRVDGIGFGICYTSVKAIQAVREAKGFNPESGQWFPDRRQVDGFGEDLGFCALAYSIGLPIYIDTGNKVDHMGDGERINGETQARKMGKGIVQAVGF